MATIAIHIRPSSKAGLCPICSVLRLTERKASLKRIKVILGVWWEERRKIFTISTMVGQYIHTRKPQPQAASSTGSSVETHHASSLRVGHMPGRLRANIALPVFGYQMSGLERPQWNGDENKNEKDKTENCKPLPPRIERCDLIPRTGIGAPHQEN